MRGLATGYEVQVDLVRGICLHEHRIDHIAHLGPSAAAGIGTLLGLAPETIYRAIGQALHTTTTTRQSRKGAISSWKAYAPAFAGKIAVEAVDRAMRGEGAPAPIYEGEDGVIARLLSGPGAVYEVPLPDPGEPKRAILDTYTKEHSAEYQSQALIDLARRMAPQVGDTARVRGRDPHEPPHPQRDRHRRERPAEDRPGREPRDPRPLDHVHLRGRPRRPRVAPRALLLPERSHRRSTVDLWRKVRTVEDPEWTARYHDPDPDKRAFGGRVEITLDDGTVVADELAVADAHPRGARPFAREQYIAKFRALAEGVVAEAEQDRFLDLACRLESLSADEVRALNLAAADLTESNTKGLF
ncbi:hypothetical protein GCM10029992_49500 [Glycomyces albus]